MAEEYRGYKIVIREGWYSDVYWDEQIIATHGPTRLQVQALRLAKDAINAWMQPDTAPIDLTVQSMSIDPDTLFGRKTHG